MVPSFEQAWRAWRTYLESGHVSHDLLSSQISRSWERCHAQRSSRRRFGARVLAPQEFTERSERGRSLIEAARPYLVALSKSAGALSHVAVLADGDAVVLDVIGDAAGGDGVPLVRRAMQLTEEYAGPSGIGTALAERTYVELVGAEHLDERLHAFTCQARPLRDVEGGLCGALALTRRVLQPSSRVAEILMCATNGVEAALVGQRVEEEVAAKLSTASELCSFVVATGRAGRPVPCCEAAAGHVRACAAELSPEVTSGLARMARCRAHARLWHELALDAFRAPQPIDVQGGILEMADLMGQEAARRGVRIVVGAADAYFLVFDPRELTRALFRGFSSALEGINECDAELVVGIERRVDGAYVRYFGPNIEVCVRLVDAGAARYLR